MRTENGALFRDCTQPSRVTTLDGQKLRACLSGFQGYHPWEFNSEEGLEPYAHTEAWTKWIVLHTA